MLSYCTRSIAFFVVASLMMIVAAAGTFAQAPHTSYQGELLVSGSPYDGNASFKCAIVEGGVNLWANDGTPMGKPSQSFKLPVVNGIFTARLGDTSVSGMTTPLTADALQTTTASIRVWVDTGSGFVQLPDVPISSSVFALQSESAKRAASGFDVDGDVQVFEDGGQRILHVDANEVATGPVVYVYDIDSQGQARPAIELDSREGTGGSTIRMFNGIEGGANPNAATIELIAQEEEGPGRIRLFDLDGNVEIEIDADIDGSSYIITDVVQIKGGMDISERFSVDGADDGLEPGSVVTISGRSPGSLELADTPYDGRVAGIVSGAGGINIGMILGQEGQPLSGDHPIALSGRVYCLADASYAPIAPGDLLTTSATPGHAMKACDLNRRSGAVLGKAMTSLESGTGLVLVLVSLQ